MDSVERMVAAVDHSVRIATTNKCLRAVKHRTTTPNPITLIHLYGQLIHLLLVPTYGFIMGNNFDADLPTIIPKLRDVVYQIDAAYLAALPKKKLHHALPPLNRAGNRLRPVATWYYHKHELQLGMIALAAAEHIDALVAPHTDFMVDNHLAVRSTAEMDEANTKVSFEEAVESVAGLFE